MFIMAKKICSWKDAIPENVFEDKATANEYVRGRMAEFNILRFTNGFVCGYVWHR